MFNFPMYGRPNYIVIVNKYSVPEIKVVSIDTNEVSPEVKVVSSTLQEVMHY